MMLTLLSQARFWTLKDDISIKNTDLGAFRYYDKKDSTDTPYSEGKKVYAEKRGMIWHPQNKRPNKLKDAIRDLEELLLHHKVVFCHWHSNCTLKIMLSSGLLINIFVDIFTGDIIKIVFDKYLVGKLLSEHVSDVVYTKTHLMCSYNDNQLTIVHFTKPTFKSGVLEKLVRLEPKLQVLDLAGPSGRRLDRKLSFNTSGDMLLVWWRCTNSEVYPWSPLVKDQDRANVHVYSISGLKVDLLCYYRTEFDPVSVSFSRVQSNVIHSVEQKVSRKGEVTVESCTYEISKSRLQRTSVTSIPLQTQVCCHSFSPDEEKLLLGCIDGSLVLYDDSRGITHFVKAAFISTMVSWHPDGAVVVAANERSQLQCFDIALSCIKNQLTSEDVTPSNLLDLASYFKNQPTLIEIEWNKKAEMPAFSEDIAPTDSLLLLHYERGPLAVLRLIGSGGLKGDPHGAGLTADILVSQYLSVNYVDKAINVLLNLNWDSYGSLCITCLHRIVNHLFRQPLTFERETQLQNALGSFYVPLRPICHATEVEFGRQVRDLTRRFFHHLLRYRKFEKAFRLAIDLNESDLFMDLYYYARKMKEHSLADAAHEKAQQIMDQCSSANSSDTESSHCSHTSCSGCSGDGSSSEADTNRIPPQPPPPLPMPRNQMLHPQNIVGLPRPVGEKQKVKFSDTVTHILVPEFSPSVHNQDDCSLQSSTRNLTTLNGSFRDNGNKKGLFLPKSVSQKLSDKEHLVPVNHCRTPVAVPDGSEEEDSTSGKIKVVHFGVV